MEKKKVEAYYKAVCTQEGITPIPLRFVRVGKGGACLTCNAITKKPLYISIDLKRVCDVEYAILHELTHQIKAITEKDLYIGKRDQLKKFKKLENRLVETYLHSKFSELLYK